MNKEDISLLGSSKNLFNTKPAFLIIILIVLGIITGIIVSNYYFTDANRDIDNWNDKIDENYEKWGNWSWGNQTWNNSTWGNQSWWDTNNTKNTSNDATWNDNNFFSEDYDPYLTPLTYEDVILPTITCVLLCIVSYILLALNVIYTKIYLETKSKYIQGLLFVLIPLLIFSTFLIRVTKSFYFSSALKYSFIKYYFGFELTGLGAIIIILTLLEIIGLAKLLQLSME